MLLSQGNKDGAACVRGVALSKPWSGWNSCKQGPWAPERPFRPPWQSRLHQYSTSRAGEALADSHWLTNLKVSCFFCKLWEAQGILKNK